MIHDLVLELDKRQVYGELDQDINYSICISFMKV